jgi:hypothetical protein
MPHDEIREPVTVLQLVVAEPAGYCDPVTGLCVMPEATGDGEVDGDMGRDQGPAQRT